MPQFMNPSPTYGSETDAQGSEISDVTKVEMQRCEYLAVLVALLRCLAQNAVSRYL